MTESNHGPAMPGTAARCEVCDQDTFGEMTACLTRFGYCWRSDCWQKGFERLKAGNASLLESLRAAEKERDEARQAAFENRPDRVLQRQIDRAVAAEQRAEAAEKERDEALADAAFVREAMAGGGREIDGLRVEAALAESRGRMLEDSMALHEKANRDLFAAEKRSAKAEKALTELLRLYDWRFELAKREHDGLNHDVEHAHETRRLLRRYGTEKKAAWEAARAALHDEERRPMEAVLRLPVDEAADRRMEELRASQPDEERSAPPPRKHWPDCGLNHGSTECDMGPDCGASHPDRAAQGEEK